MSSLSAVESYATTYSEPSALTLNVQPEQQNTETTTSVLVAERLEQQTIAISQEALAKFKAYTEGQREENSVSNPLRTAEGAAVVQSGPLSEEEHTRLMEIAAADSEKFILDYLAVLDEVWGNLSTVTKQIDQTYASFLEQLAEDNPDLKDAFFGFSVNKDGTLFITQAKGLDKKQIERIEQALNSDDDLVALANDLADAQIAVFNVHDGFNTQKTLNRDNYGQTIDMGIDLLTRNLARFAPRDGTAIEIHRRNWNSNWYNQL